MYRLYLESLDRGIVYDNVYKIPSQSLNLQSKVY